MLGTVLLCKVYTGHKAWYTRQGIQGKVYIYTLYKVYKVYKVYCLRPKVV